MNADLDDDAVPWVTVRPEVCVIQCKRCGARIETIATGQAFLDSLHDFERLHSYCRDPRPLSERQTINVAV